MQFDRLIKYLDYVENGERVRGAGFLKLQTRNGKCDLQLQVSGMHATDHFYREVFLITAEGEMQMHEVALNGGRGSLQLCDLNCENLAGTGVAYEKLLGIRIPIAAGREICCKIREDVPEKLKLEELHEERVILEELQQEEALEDVAQYEEIQSPSAVIASDVLMSAAPTPEEPMRDEYMPDFASVGLAENKWKQLCAIYPHIAPFKDEREYLSIGPGDFVILSEKYYRMANNSFLLHGYYNYKHLILCRIEQKEQPVYYIGVPGNYFEREKQVAVLFGFESFEGMKESATAGDYGYYMLRVEL